MNSSIWSFPWFTIPVLLFFIAGLGLLLIWPYGGEIIYLNPWRSEPLNTFFRLLTRLGEAPAFVITGLLLLLWRFRFALVFALAGLVITPLSYVLKDQIGTDRPITYFEKEGLREEIVLVPGVELNGGQTSFPSGHTMAAFGLYGTVALLTACSIPWLGLACAWTAILVGISRIFLVQHFLLDVLGGASIGLLVALICWRVNSRIQAKFKLLDAGLFTHLPFPPRAGRN